MKQHSQLAEVLVRSGVLSTGQSDSLLQEHQKWGGQLAVMVVELGLVREEQLVHILSKELRLPLAPLERMRSIPSDALGILAATTCERLNVLPLGIDVVKKRLQLAVADPTESEMLHELRASTGLEIEPFVSTTTVIRRSIRVNFYGENTAEVLRVIPELEHTNANHKIGSSPGGLPQATSQVSHHKSGSRMPLIPPGTQPPLGSRRTPLPRSQPKMRTAGHAVVHPSGGEGPFRSGWNPSAPAASHPASLELDAATEVAAMKKESSRSGPSHTAALASQQALQAVALGAAEQQISQLQGEVSQLHGELGQLHTDMQTMRQQLQHTRQHLGTEVEELQSLLRTRFQEHRMLMRGLFDLLVARGHLQKEELVKMLSDVSTGQHE